MEFGKGVFLCVLFFVLLPHTPKVNLHLLLSFVPKRQLDSQLTIFVFMLFSIFVVFFLLGCHR